jgi:hypothetical protein
MLCVTLEPMLYQLGESGSHSDMSSVMLIFSGTDTLGLHFKTNNCVALPRGSKGHSSAVDQLADVVAFLDAGLKHLPMHRGLEALGGRARTPLNRSSAL